MPASDRLDDLIRVNTKDMLESFGLGEVRRGRKLLEAGCRWPARRFAETVLAFDARVARDGLQAAAAWGLGRFATRLRVAGCENVPSSGPVLLLSNHPGITDTLCLFAATPRADLHTVAAVRPFLTALDNMAQRLIYVDEESNAHLGVVRTVTHHLRQGGAVMTFPAGRIEPDPAVLPGATAALATWSDSIGLFARLAPATRIVPVVVSGVFSLRALRSPLVRIRRVQKDRERLAAMLQIVAPWQYPVEVTVAFAPPLVAGDLLTQSSSTGVKEAVVAAMRSLLATNGLLP